MAAGGRPAAPDDPDAGAGRDPRSRAASEGDADRIHRQYLVNEFRQGDDHLRLLPTQADRDAYRAIILRTPGTTATGAVAEAYRFFRTVLTSVDDPDDDQDIARIEQTIRAGLSIVEITAERSDNVYRIFESLNNTGLQLSQADLLRNYLFMRLPSRGEDVYRDVWLPMQNRLRRRIWSCSSGSTWSSAETTGSSRPRSTVPSRTVLSSLPKTEEAIEAEVAELARRSRHLERILHPAAEPDRRLRSALLRLKAWGAATAYPLVMHLLDLLERGVADAGDVAEALVYVESFLVRRMLCQVPTNNLNRVFNAAPASHRRSGTGRRRRPQLPVRPPALLAQRRRGAAQRQDPAVLLDRARPAAHLRPAPARGELPGARAGRLQHSQAHHRARAAADPDR